MARLLHRKLAATLVITFFSLSVTDTLAQAKQPDYFTGNSLPTPPQQFTPWLPPENTLPAEFVSAMTKLFEQGLADPRGCEYREVEMTTGRVMGNTATIKVHAWVLPADPNSRQRFAVGWNGLVYPTLAVGPAVDFRDDVTAAIKADQAMRDDFKRKQPDRQFYRFRNARSGESYLSQETLLPIKACLLLRLGEAGLAADVWRAWTTGMRDGFNDDSIHLKDPYMMLATDWVWALFDRAVTAHMRADDNLALLSARALVPIQKTIDDEAGRRGFGKYYFGGANFEGRSFLGFLEPLPALLADQERRALEKSQNARPPTNSDRSVGVQTLICNLENVAAPQLDQPGAIDWSLDPTMIELQRRGKDVVEPLLAVLESDKRLTRSVSFSRSFHYDRHVAGVPQAAFVALIMILKTSKFGPLDGFTELRTMEARRALAAEIRTYFKKYGDASLSERWYGLLADDSATGEQWEEAATNIVRFTRYVEGGQVTLPVPRMQGELLRGKVAPTVSELLLSRMQTVAQSFKPDDELSWIFSLQRSASIATALAAWDGAHYHPELRQFSDRLRHQWDDAKANRREYLRHPMVTLYLKRADSDAGALREYTDWLLTLNPADCGYNVEFLFQPAWHHTNDPVVIEAINRLFNDPASRWLPIIATYPNTQVDTSNLLPTPLLGFTAFREEVLRALTDKSVVGTLTPRARGLDGEYELKVENSVAAAFAGGPNINAVVMKIDRTNDPNPPQKVLTPVQLRTCDVYAWKLRLIEGAPQLKVYWSEAQRDAVIEELATFLRNHKGPFVNSNWRASGMEY